MAKQKDIDALRKYLDRLSNRAGKDFPDNYESVLQAAESTIKKPDYSSPIVNKRTI